MRPTHIILHHSQTADGRTLSWDDIRRYHIVTNGWSDIGYHFGIEKIEDETVTLVGRMQNETGAHCADDRMNHHSLGICLVGNFDNGEPPVTFWNAAQRLVRSLLEVYGIPAANVQGHREHNPGKTCPGKMFDLEKFRSQLI